LTHLETKVKKGALVEFSACFGGHDERNLDEAGKEKLKASLLALMDAAGFKNIDDESLRKKSPHEILQVFAVGTERGKNKLPDPPDPAMLGPIRNFQRVSPEEKAKVVLVASAAEDVVALAAEDVVASVAEGVAPSVAEDVVAPVAEDVVDHPSTPDEDGPNTPDYLLTSRLCYALHLQNTLGQRTC
jgi:hypothetical protein